jgi:hypothetical protein
MGLEEIKVEGVGTEFVLVGAVFAGEDDCFFVTIPGKEHITQPRIVNLTAAEWKQMLRVADLKEVEVDAMDPATGKVVRAVVRKCERQVSKHISWQVFRRDGFQCRYCGADDVPMTVDHLVTWESGGPSIEENLVTSCGRCNNLRGEMPLADWLKSSIYKKRSKGLSMSEKFANQALLPTLDAIPRVPIKLKKGKKQARKRR